ncbi:MAG: S9 family peptidase [Bacteroidales bacterium]|nr:S9 family peptidase [Bacteroidales bacterium]
MKRTLFLLFIALMTKAYAERPSIVQQFLCSPFVTIHQPLQTDTVDVKGNKFDTKSLLKSKFSPTFFSKVNVDTAGIVHFSKPNAFAQLLQCKFYLLVDRYSSLKIDISSPQMFEVYVNGEKVTDKTTTDENFAKVSPITYLLKAEPRRYEFVVKLLAKADDKCDPALKVSVINTKGNNSDFFTTSVSPKRNLWINDFWEGKHPKSTSISPNGKYASIKYITSYKDGTANSSSEIVEIATGKVLMTDDTQSIGWAWMPLSNKLYYTTKGGKGNELRIIDPVSQDDKLLVPDLPEGSFDWSPNENYLIFSKSETADEEYGNMHRFLSPEDRQSGWRKRSSLFIYDLKTNLMERLTFGRETTYLNDISDDEKYILFSTRPDVVTERPFSESNLYRMNIETRQTDTIFEHEKFAVRAMFSPDGKQLLLSGSGEAFGGIGLKITKGQTSNLSDMQAFLMDLGSKKIEPITKDFNPSISSASWSRSDGLIYFTADDEDYEHAFSYDPKRKKFQMLSLPLDIVSGFHVASKEAKAIFYGQGVLKSVQVYALDLKSKKEKLLSDPSTERLQDAQLGRVEDWNFKSTDGTAIKGRFYLPPQFDASKKYPLLVYFYGGTTPTDRSFEQNYPLNLYAAMGYVVYTLQPSGCIGFGQEFSARHVNAWGIKTADEIIQGTEEFCQMHGFVDSTRIGCMGASYGGFMTQYLQTKTNLFKAAISHAGISSLTSYWGEGYWGYTYSGLASAGSYPWNNEALYVEQSPLFHADKIKAPLLLLHGSADTNVPIGESIQMYTALKILGAPVEFIRVEGENHQVTSFSKRLDFQKTILAWFEKYLQNNPLWWDELYKKNPLEK